MNAEILFLCHRLPYPPNKGDKIRSHALLSYLAERYKVHVGCFIDDPADFAHADAVRGLAKGECLFVPLSPARKWLAAPLALLSGKPITTAYFGSGELAKWVGTLVKTRGLEQAVVFSSAMAPYLLDSLELDPARAIFDLVDVDSDKWRQYAAAASWPKSWVFRREAKKLLELERTAAKAFGATLLVSPFEAETFGRLAPEVASRLHVVCNGVDLKRFAPGTFANPFSALEIPIVMTGRMDYPPNVDGALWFAREVMPKLIRSIPKARFHVIGSSPPKSLRSLNGTEIRVHGQVDDVRPFLQHAAAVVAPLRMARGVQNKVLEALAMARPVVATLEASRAFQVTSGSELWIENDANSFANAVVEAAQGKTRGLVASQGRKYVERCHNWQENLAPLAPLLSSVAQGQWEAVRSPRAQRSPSSTGHTPSSAAQQRIPIVEIEQ